jgi:hypothetical protein
MPVYTRTKLLLATDRLNWTVASAVFRCLLLGPTYTYSRAHTTVLDVQAHEVAHASYSRRVVANRTVVEDVGEDMARLQANSVLFPALDGVTVAGAVIYRQLGGDDLTPENDSLVVFLPCASTVMTGRDVLVEFATGTVLSLSAT